MHRRIEDRRVPSAQTICSMETIDYGIQCIEWFWNVSIRSAWLQFVIIFNPLASKDCQLSAYTRRTLAFSSNFTNFVCLSNSIQIIRRAILLAAFLFCSERISKFSIKKGSNLWFKYASQIKMMQTIFETLASSIFTNILNRLHFYFQFIIFHLGMEENWLVDSWINISIN